MCPVAESWPEVEDVCLDVAVDRVCLDVSKWRSFEFTSKIVDPKSVGVAKIDSVRSRSEADFREAEVVVGNNAATECNTTGINLRNSLRGATRRGLFVGIGGPCDPESADALEIDSVSSRSDADFREAEVVVGNNATAGTNFLTIAVRNSRCGFIRSSSVDTGSLGDPEATNGVAEIDRVGSRSDTVARKAKPVVGNDVATEGDTPDISPGNVFGGFTMGPFVASGRLSNPESAGAAEIDGVRSRSKADLRDAEVVAGNNAGIRFNTRGINTAPGNDSTLADGLIRAVKSFDMAPSKVDVPGWAEPWVNAP